MECEVPNDADVWNTYNDIVINSKLQLERPISNELNIPENMKIMYIRILFSNFKHRWASMYGLSEHTGQLLVDTRRVIIIHTINNMVPV